MSSEPTPPYVAVIFTSRLNAATCRDPREYEEMSVRMEQLASEQPGFLGVESARRTDGTGITVSYWVTTEDAVAWKRVHKHREAQARGRTEWYESYKVRIATVGREYAGPD